jgi:hypothetical protein
VDSSEARDQRRGAGGNETEDQNPFTFTGPCTFTVSTAPYEPVSSRAGERRAAPLERKRTACWRSWKSKTGLGLGFGLGRGWSSRYCAHGGQRRSSSHKTSLGLEFPPLPPGEGCWRLSGASGASGVRARVASHGHARREETPASASTRTRVFKELQSRVHLGQSLRQSHHHPKSREPIHILALTPFPPAASQAGENIPLPGGEGDHLESLFSMACERVR